MSTMTLGQVQDEAQRRYPDIHRPGETEAEFRSRKDRETAGCGACHNGAMSGHSCLGSRVEPQTISCAYERKLFITGAKFVLDSPGSGHCRAASRSEAVVDRADLQAVLGALSLCKTCFMTHRKSVVATRVDLGGSPACDAHGDRDLEIADAIRRLIAASNP